MCPGFESRTQRHMWVEFVVGSLPCSKRFFSGYSGFPLSSKTNISKFQFDLDYCQVLYHEPLARVIAQALPVFDIKFTFTFTFLHTPCGLVSKRELAIVIYCPPFPKTKSGGMLNSSAAINGRRLAPSQ